MTFIPLNDFILVKEIEEESKVGSIFLVGTIGQPTKGRVVAVGPGRKTETGYLIEPTVTRDDVVYYPQNAGQLIAIGYEDFKLLRFAELIGKEGS